MVRMGRMFPGGPTRDDGEENQNRERTRHTLTSVSEIEERISRGTLRHRQHRRRRLVLRTVFLSLLIAMGVGIWIGVQSYRSEEERALDLQHRAQPEEFDAEKAVDRVIDEIWKTEALEKLRKNR